MGITSFTRLTTGQESDPKYTADRAVPLGAATLDITGNVPSSQLGNVSAGGGITRAYTRIVGGITSGGGFFDRTFTNNSPIQGTVGHVIIEGVVPEVRFIGTGVHEIQLQIVQDGSPYSAGTSTMRGTFNSGDKMPMIFKFAQPANFFGPTNSVWVMRFRILTTAGSVSWNNWNFEIIETA